MNKLNIEFNIHMDISHNFAQFKSIDGKYELYIDSFDNLEFNVRFGTIEKSWSIGSVIAKNSEELNNKIKVLIESLNKKS